MRQEALKTGGGLPPPNKFDSDVWKPTLVKTYKY